MLAGGVGAIASRPGAWYASLNKPTWNPPNVGTTLEFFRIRKIAGGLMLPYLIWVTFAGVLNASLYLKN